VGKCLHPKSLGDEKIHPQTHSHWLDFMYLFILMNDKLRSIALTQTDNSNAPPWSVYTLRGKLRTSPSTLVMRERENAQGTSRALFFSKMVE
jgi:hypothetical protein